MSTKLASDKKLRLSYKTNFLTVSIKANFIDFCKGSDLKAAQRHASPLGRRELEAAYIQELVYKYDKITEEDLEEVIRRPYTKEEQDMSAWRRMKYQLEHAVKKVSSNLPAPIRCITS